MSSLRIGLDIDDVLANFLQAFIERGRRMGFGDDLPAHWTLVREWLFGGNAFGEVWNAIAHDHEFWLKDIQPHDRAFVPFQPTAYITNRPIPSDITAQWLRRHGFPDAPVITVPGSKVDAVLEADIDVFVDDKPEHFEDINAAGRYCLLYDAPHNGDVDARLEVYREGDQLSWSTIGRLHYLRDLPTIVSILERYDQRLEVGA